MARTPVGTETAFRRELQLALELLDPGSLDSVADGVQVRTPGSSRIAQRNLSGHFIWLKGKDAPQRVQVDPGDLPFEAEAVDLTGLTTPRLQLRLRPKPGYQLPGGALGVASSLDVEPVDPPAAPQGVAGAVIRLQWMDDGSGSWIDAETPSLTQSSGDFVCVLRLRPGDVPALDAQGAQRARLQVRRGQEQRTTPEFALRQGPLQHLPALHWSEL